MSTRISAVTTAKSQLVAIRQDLTKFEREIDTLEHALANANQRIEDLEQQLTPAALEISQNSNHLHPTVGPSGALWSTHYFSAGQTLNHSVWRLFTTPLGYTGQGAERGLNISDTNLKEGGRMPFGYAYDVEGIVVEFLGGTDTDVQALKDSVLGWEWVQTTQTITPLGSMDWIDARRGIMRTSQTLPNDTTFSMTLAHGSSVHRVEVDLRLRVTLCGSFKEVTPSKYDYSDGIIDDLA